MYKHVFLSRDIEIIHRPAHIQLIKEIREEQDKLIEKQEEQQKHTEQQENLEEIFNQKTVAGENESHKAGASDAANVPSSVIDQVPDNTSGEKLKKLHFKQPESNSNFFHN